MRLSISITRIALIGALLSVTCYAQQKDVLGWEHSRWGMTETDLASAFGSKLTKLPQRQSFLDLHADRVVSPFELEGERFTVFFQMDNVTNKLSQVLVKLNEMDSRLPREALFTKLDSLLTHQYGSPDSRSDERDSKSTIKSIYLTREWRFPTTTVELYYGWDSQIYASLLTIRYFPHGGTRINDRRITRRWTGAAVACFASSSARRGLNEIAPPGQL